MYHPRLVLLTHMRRTIVCGKDDRVVHTAGGALTAQGEGHGDEYATADGDGHGDEYGVEYDDDAAVVVTFNGDTSVPPPVDVVVVGDGDVW